MDVAVEIGRNHVSFRFSLSMEIRLTRDETAEPIPRDQILRRERGHGKKKFPCSAEHEQNWQPYPVESTVLAWGLTKLLAPTGFKFFKFQAKKIQAPALST